MPVPVAKVWQAWTVPERLVQWFTPKPWETASCEIDLRPGGLFRTVMRSPEGEEVGGDPGCYLEVVPLRRLVFTDALGPGYRPNADSFMTVFVEMAPHQEGTAYRVVVRHANPQTRQKHVEMGFELGWNKALDQLVERAPSW